MVLDACDHEVLGFGVLVFGGNVAGGRPPISPVPPVQIPVRRGLDSRVGVDDAHCRPAAEAAAGLRPTEPTPSEQLDRDLQRVAEDAVKDIDTTGFDALE